MKCSKAMLQALKIIEGYKKEVYKDSVGLLTIGVGHLIQNNDKILAEILGVSPETIILDPAELDHIVLTEAQVDELFSIDVERFEAAINKRLSFPVMQHEFDALVSFAFNIGVKNFDTSSVLKFLNQQAFSQAAESFINFRMAGRPLKQSQGLVNRREFERLVFKFPEFDISKRGQWLTTSKDIKIVTSWIATYTMHKDFVD